MILCTPHLDSLHSRDEGTIKDRTFGNWSRKDGGGEAGFTLIEMMCVLFLTALLMGLVVPNLYRSWEREQLKASIREVITVLRQARGTAAARNKPVKVFFELDTGSYQWEEAGVKHCRASFQPAGTQLVWQDQKRHQGFLIFYGDGSSSGGQLTLVGPNQRVWVISVDKFSGKVSLK
jgi:general secretion pathway protein H